MFNISQPKAAHHACTTNGSSKLQPLLALLSCRQSASRAEDASTNHAATGGISHTCTTHDPHPAAAAIVFASPQPMQTTHSGCPNTQRLWLGMKRGLWPPQLLLWPPHCWLTQIINDAHDTQPHHTHALALAEKHTACPSSPAERTTHSLQSEGTHTCMHLRQNTLCGGTTCAPPFQQAGTHTLPCVPTQTHSKQQAHTCICDKAHRAVAPPAHAHPSLFKQARSPLQLLRRLTCLPQRQQEAPTTTNADKAVNASHNPSKHASWLGSHAHTKQASKLVRVTHTSVHTASKQQASKLVRLKHTHSKQASW
jgi:hypothetical protein